MKRAIAAAFTLAAATGAGDRPVAIERHAPELDFTYEWPSEAAGIPALDRRFRAEAEREYQRHLKLGRADKQSYTTQQRGSVTDFYRKVWSTSGQAPRLLSLRFEHSTFTGGAHPNTDYGALLWDRRLNREVPPASVLLHADAFAVLMRIRYCAALNAERVRRRQGERMGVAEFDQCPRFSDLAIAPVDSDRNGRFDQIEFVASPYTAGLYAEGKYAISLPVTSRFIGAMRPEYRNSFERQRQ